MMLRPACDYGTFVAPVGTMTVPAKHLDSRDELLLATTWAKTQPLLRSGWLCVPAVPPMPSASSSPASRAAEATQLR